jgi:hypothetical protein
MAKVIHFSQQRVKFHLTIERMKEITLKIPENKFRFFMELIANLGFETIEDVEIPEEHKAIVRERIKNSKPEDLIPWKEARKQLKIKSNTKK